MAITYILSGGNVGDREKIQAIAVDEVRNRVGRILDRSDIYETAPWGFDDENHFLNQVLKVDTDLFPEDLLHELLIIEEQQGRVRDKEKGYQRRSLDLDILYYDDVLMFSPELTIPHPRLHERKFTLKPLHDIAPDLWDPLRERSVEAMMLECTDPLDVKPFSRCTTTT